MNFLNALGNLFGIGGDNPMGAAAGLPGVPAPAMPGAPPFSGQGGQAATLQGQPNMLGNLSLPDMSGVQSDLNMMRAQDAAAMAPKHSGGGFKNVLGMLGDALLQANGHEPIYAPHKKQQQLGESLAGYLGGDNPQLADILRADPSTGVALWNAMRKPDIPAEAQDFKYYQGLPADQRSQYERYLQLTHPGMNAPLSLGANDTYVPAGAPGNPTGGAGASMPFAATPEEARKYPPGTTINTPYGVKRVPGGATASPSPTFP